MPCLFGGATCHDTRARRAAFSSVSLTRRDHGERPVPPDEHTVESQVSGLVAAYGYDEGAGTSFTDASGNNNAGTVSGATWAAGRSEARSRSTASTTSRP